MGKTITVGIAGLAIALSACAIPTRSSLPAPYAPTSPLPPLGSTATVPSSPLDHDGLYHIGYDIPAGVYTYVVNGPVGYYAICKDISCTLPTGILKNDNFSQGNTGYIDLTLAGASYVELRGLTLRPVK